MSNTNQRGVSLYFTIIIMAVLLGIALGINALLIGQLKMIREMGNSVVALYAADTGIEQTLKNRANPFSVCSQSSCSLDNGAQYYISITPKGGDCSADNFCIKSVGSYKGTKRAIEITY